MEFIVEHLLGDLERDAMLPLVLRRLPFVPLESIVNHSTRGYLGVP